MKKQILKSLASADNQLLLTEKRLHLLKLRLNKKIKGTECSHEIRDCRRSIARLLTLKG